MKDEPLELNGIISVVVIKPFNELRTPCPPEGTVGELYDIKAGFYCVRFKKPMVDTEGGIWSKSDEDSDEPEYMMLKFKEDEISENININQKEK